MASALCTNGHVLKAGDAFCSICWAPAGRQQPAGGQQYGGPQQPYAPPPPPGYAAPGPSIRYAGDQGQAPPPRKSHGLRNALIVLAAIIALGAFGVTKVCSSFLNDKADAETETRIWIDKLAAGDAAGAYASASSGFQAAVPLEQMNGLVDRFRDTKPTISFTSWNINKGTGGSIAELGGSISGVAGVSNIEVKLVKQDGIWKVEFFNFR